MLSTLLKFIYFCLHWFFVAACGLSLVVRSGAYSSLQNAGSGARRLQSLAAHRLSSGGPWVLEQVLEAGLHGCGTWAKLPHCMWDLCRAGIRPVFPALAGRFLTTGPPGKSISFF